LRAVVVSAEVAASAAILLATRHYLFQNERKKTQTWSELQWQVFGRSLRICRSFNFFLWYLCCGCVRCARVVAKGLVEFQTKASDDTSRCCDHFNMLQVIFFS